MPELSFAATQGLASIPSAFWVWGAATCLLSAAIGFAAGVLYGRSSIDRALERAKRHVSKLYSLVVHSLDQAQEACAVLEKFPNLQLSSKQTDQLHGKRSELLNVVENIVDRQVERLAAAAKKREESAKLVSEQLTSGWLREPLDVVTGIPDRCAFEQNLQKMLEFATRSETEAGLLLVRLDKYDQHKSRYRAVGVERFLKTMSSIICRAIREDDIVCRCRPDTFAVLIPNADAEGARAQAIALRNSIRSSQFRINETGPEVLVTASFGLARCLSHDTVELAMNRAINALSQSSRRGRNQLHEHDGDELSHCVNA